MTSSKPHAALIKILLFWTKFLQSLVGFYDNDHPRKSSLLDSPNNGGYEILEVPNERESR